jgi:hypothetical protein
MKTRFLTVAADSEPVGVCVEKPCIHRFLWSRLVKVVTASIADNEPRD